MSAALAVLLPPRAALAVQLPSRAMRHALSLTPRWLLRAEAIMKPLAAQVTKSLIDPVVEAVVPEAFIELETSANASTSTHGQPQPATGQSTAQQSPVEATGAKRGKKAKPAAGGTGN